MNGWTPFIEHEKTEPYYIALKDFVFNDAKTNVVYPPFKDVFSAFKLTPLERVKVVVLGQDCYINAGQAHGLAFSVPRGIRVPPSLRNIYKELQSDLNIAPPSHGNLTSLAERGVLLLNSVLTVRAGQSGSHKEAGWQTFTNKAIGLVNQQDRPIAFLLWGSYARNKRSLITNDKHLVLEAAHPSPLSAHNGFFGCKHFSQTNAFLIEHDIEPIDWTLTQGDSE